MPRESKAALKKRTAAIARILKKRFPNATTALNWSNPLELLVATILSAQCTDERVNAVTAELFGKYKTARDWAQVPQAQLEKEIKTTGFFRNKAKSIRAAAALLVENFGGKVPDSMDHLLTLPGVARKTANVVLGTAFGKNEGIVVDTHVMRVSQRLKLTRRKNNQGDKIEKDLTELVPRAEWTTFGHTMVLHGRGVCMARKPNCAECGVARLCPSALEA